MRILICAGLGAILAVAGFFAGRASTGASAGDAPSGSSRFLDPGDGRFTAVRADDGWPAKRVYVLTDNERGAEYVVVVTNSGAAITPRLGGPATKAGDRE